MKKLLFALTLVVSVTAACFAEKISDIQQTGSWVYLYNESGKRYKTMSASSVGEILGWSSSFFVSQKGGWIYLHDSDGKRYKTMSASSVGDVIGVAGNTFTSRKGGWIYTYDASGKRINTRSAH